MRVITILEANEGRWTNDMAVDEEHIIHKPLKEQEAMRATLRVWSFAQVINSYRRDTDNKKPK